MNQIAKAVNTDIAGTGAFDKVKLLHLLISIDQQLRELRQMIVDFFGMVQVCQKVVLIIY